MSILKLLIVEDDDLMQNMLTDALNGLPLDLHIAGDGEKGLEAFRREQPQIVLLDMKLPRKDGMTVLKEIKSLAPDCSVIMMTAYGTIETAVEAMKIGAFDFISKPFMAEELAMLVQRVIAYRNLQDENRALRAELKGRCGPRELVGNSHVMQEVGRLIQVAAPRDSTVLITGESGTGKEVVAETLHKYSSRKHKPLIRVSCGALTESLLESELFGHEKGAFTDASRRRLGRFEAARGGTIFLDDVDDLSAVVQMKLLRVLQEKTIERVGGNETLHVDVRVVAATKVDLREAVKAGSFREDLFYRLNVVPLRLPPLRQRREDIPLLIEHFLEKYSREMQRRLSFTPEAVDHLMSYSWPGNIRELENLVEQFVAISSEEIVQAHQLPESMRGTAAWTAGPLKSVVAEAETRHIRRVLEQTDGKKKEAAAILGITPKTLWMKMKDYQIRD